MRKIIGFSDQDGYLFCQKHANSKMDTIFDDSPEFGYCEICHQKIGDDNSDINIII